MKRPNALNHGINGRKSVMSQIKAERFRVLAAECERQAELATEEPQFRALQEKLARSYAALADTEDWLDGAPSQPTDRQRSAADDTLKFG